MVPTSRGWTGRSNEAVGGVEAMRRVGSTLRGRYRLDAVLGVGTLAVAYRATLDDDAAASDVCAVEVLHPELARRDEVRWRFRRDGYTANSVRHPAVALVRDDDEHEDGTMYLVREHVDGENAEALRRRLGGRVSPARACAIVGDVLDVLVAAHAKGFIHRDVTLANVIVTPDGRTKLLDFGLGRAKEAAGTRPPGRPDARSDLRAVGELLHGLVAGAAPGPLLPDPRVPDVPPALASLVDRALAEERDGGGFLTAVAMRAALEEARLTLK